MDSQQFLMEEIQRTGVVPHHEDPEWKDFWSYVQVLAALRGKKMVIATPGKAPVYVPATPMSVDAGGQKGRRGPRISMASSLGAIDENDQSEANLSAYQDGITEDEPEEALADKRASTGGRGTKRKAAVQESSSRGKRVREEVVVASAGRGRKAAPSLAIDETVQEEEEATPMEEEEEEEEEQPEEEPEPEPVKTRTRGSRVPLPKMALVESDEESDLEESGLD